MEDCRKWKIRKKVGYEAQQRFWISKGWKYRNWNLLVGFNRWCKLLGDKEIWAFEHEVCERYIVYGFVVGTGPCATLADAQLKRVALSSCSHSVFSKITLSASMSANGAVLPSSIVF